MIGKQAIVLQHIDLDSVMAILIDTDTLYIFCTIFYLVFSILLAHFLCNTIMPLFTNILNFQNDVYHFVTLLYKMTSHLAKMIIPGYFKTFYVAAATRAEQSFIRQFYIFYNPVTEIFYTLSLLITHCF